MQLKTIQLNEFRNIGRAQLDLRPRLNFLLGENGQGKTNFLEAVYLLCRGQSFRVADAKSLLKKDGPQRAKLTGQFETKGLDYLVDVILEPGRRSASINGKKTNSANLAANFPLVLFSPESLAVIKDGPDQRRHLIDEILLTHDPRQSRLLREFQRALKARNRLLRNLVSGVGSRHTQILSLESLNTIYFVLATHLTNARILALRDIKPYFVDAMASLQAGSQQKSADISVDYVVSGESALNWSESQIFDALHKRHQTLALKEIDSGTSLVGPHKHDIRLLFAGNDSRFYCSQGQQRALILALKIAQIVYHHGVHQTYPVLLLDDVMSELDAKKRINLMKFVETISAQILITATDLTWSKQFSVERNSIFTVANGCIEFTEKVSELDQH